MREMPKNQAPKDSTSSGAFTCVCTPSCVYTCFKCVQTPVSRVYTFMHAPVSCVYTYSCVHARVSHVYICFMHVHICFMCTCFTLPVRVCMHLFHTCTSRSCVYVSCVYTFMHAPVLHAYTCLCMHLFHMCMCLCTHHPILGHMLHFTDCCFSLGIVSL